MLYITIHLSALFENCFYTEIIDEIVIKEFRRKSSSTSSSFFSLRKLLVSRSVGGGLLFFQKMKAAAGFLKDVEICLKTTRESDTADMPLSRSSPEI